MQEQLKSQIDELHEKLRSQYELVGQITGKWNLFVKGGGRYSEAEPNRINELAPVQKEINLLREQLNTAEAELTALKNEAARKRQALIASNLDGALEAEGQKLATARAHHAEAVARVKTIQDKMAALRGERLKIAGDMEAQPLIDAGKIMRGEEVDDQVFEGLRARSENIGHQIKALEAALKMANEAENQSREVSRHQEREVEQIKRQIQFEKQTRSLAKACQAFAKAFGSESKDDFVNAVVELVRRGDLPSTPSWPSAHIEYVNVGGRAAA